MIENINLKSDYFACNIFIFWCFKYFVVNLLPCSGHWRGLADDDGAAGGIVRPSNNFLFLTHFEDQKHISPISNILRQLKIHFTNQKHNSKQSICYPIHCATLWGKWFIERIAVISFRQDFSITRFFRSMFDLIERKNVSRRR